MTALYNATTKILSHYRPFWMGMMLSAAPWLLRSALHAANATGVDVQSPWALLQSLVFGLLGFWIWALTTNSHSHHLAATSGRRSGTKEDRKHEFSMIMFLGFLTIGAYFVAILSVWPVWCGFYCAITFCFPFLFLRGPDHD